eukprot:TRINITY_DN3368_c0_g4_i1.p1 TRINITY_DN3368_c0_g4~~TRINITY_DN3368_c0_g4_i1.p1  ORF type:complete len:511 (+),score=39.22 TRINITY_DN3368_c0_g4_i1:73-1533(+)
MQENGRENVVQEFCPVNESLQAPCPVMNGFGSPYSHVHDRFLPNIPDMGGNGDTPLHRAIVMHNLSAEQDQTDDPEAVYRELVKQELLGNGSTGQSSSIQQMGNEDSSDRWQQMYGPKRAVLKRCAGSNVLNPFATNPLSQELEGGVVAQRNTKKSHRKIQKSAFKVLDAPGLQDDFYLNLVDWSSQNLLAVGLGSCVYLWNACTCKVTKLCDLGSQEPICSVCWSCRGSVLAVGTHSGEVQLWDPQRLEQVRKMPGHSARVGCMAWNSRILSTGSRDRSILHRDIRAPGNFTIKCQQHRSEICGLKWSHDDRLLASGGNDNQLLVWTESSGDPLAKFDAHCAAVKALAWSPHQAGILASGGGTADRCIKIWNMANNSAVSSLDTGSQVCNLSWSKNVDEIVSTHGYSQNQIIVWKYPSMRKLATLTGHTLRVLYLATSPDGQVIVTGAGDETLRFWNVFPGPRNRGNNLTRQFNTLYGSNRILIR